MTSGPGYETTDVHVRSINKFLGILYVLLLVSIVFSIGLFYVFRNRDAAENPEPSPVQSRERLPEGPRLLVDEPATLADLRKRELQTLATYGWEDKNAQVVRLPVARAIELVAERGLPNFGASPAPGAAPAKPAPHVGHAHEPPPAPKPAPPKQ